MTQSLKFMLNLQSLPPDERRELVKRSSVVICIAVNVLLISVVYSFIHFTLLRIFALPFIIWVPWWVATQSAKRLG